MIYGLVAAAAWGLSTIAAAQAARRIGTYAALLASQLLGAALLGLLAAVVRPPLADLHGLTLLGLVGAGLLGLIGWLTYYRALESGPVGVVSAVAATYGGIAALLAVIALGEHLGAGGGAGVILAVGGVVMAAAQASGSKAAGKARGSGIALVLASVVTYGTGSFALGGFSARVGWLAAAFRRAAEKARGSGVALALASAVTYGTGSFALGGFSARVGWLAAALVAYGSSVAALVLAMPFRLARGRGLAVAAVPAGDVLAGVLPGFGLAPVHHDRLDGDCSEAARLARGRGLAVAAVPAGDVLAGVLPGFGLAPVHHDRLDGDWSEAALALVPQCRMPARSARSLRPGVASNGDGSAYRRRRLVPGYAWAAAAGVTEAAALAAFSRGGQAGQVAITAAVSSLYPLIPLAAGLWLFGERLRTRQILGVALIVAGLVMISLS